MDLILVRVFICVSKGKHGVLHQACQYLASQLAFQHPSSFPQARLHWLQRITPGAEFEMLQFQIWAQREHMSRTRLKTATCVFKKKMVRNNKIETVRFSIHQQTKIYFVG